MNANQFVWMVAKMKKEDEYPELKSPPSEEWISGLNSLIETAREVLSTTVRKPSKKGKK